MDIETEKSEFDEVIKTANISKDEQDYLLALNKFATKAKRDIVEDGDLNIDKEASKSKYASRVKKHLGNVGNFLSENRDEVMAGAAVLPIAAMGAKYMYDGARRMADPLVENYRYRRMQRLPGGQVHQNLGGVGKDVADSFYIPTEEGGEQLAGDERSERAVRKAFEMMHQRNPDITKNPIMAKSFLQNNLERGRADQFADRVTQQGITDEQLMEMQNRRKNEGRFVDDVGRTVDMLDDASSAANTLSKKKKSK